jgi:prepilin-type N-terminal cleavage/methylation domain-containing protein
MSRKIQIVSRRFSCSCRSRRQRAYTLVEMTVVLIIMSVLVSMALPRFSRSLESARADIAGANLRAIWSAERIYWLDHRTYTGNLSDLVNANLIDPSILTDTFYNYGVTTPDPPSVTFTATAQRAPGVSWSGTLTIAQDGGFTGTLQCSGQADIVVGFQ